MDLSVDEKKLLLEAARNKITSIFHSSPEIEADYKVHPTLKCNCGVFCTLTINNYLRGCIGYIESEKPVLETLKMAAVQAAMNDPRFTPINEDELEKINIEISILSEPFPMKSYDDIELGKHGVILDEYGKRGLLLPQVPIEHNMSKEEYLGAICQKAGLPAESWKEKVLNMELFTASVFSEKEMEKE